MDEDDVVDPNQNQDQNKKIDPTNPEIQAMIKSAVAEAVKDVKVKLDAAYAKRDEALQKVSEFEQKERDLQRPVQAECRDEQDERHQPPDAEIARHRDRPGEFYYIPARRLRCG